MQVRKVLNMEDLVTKHVDIKRALANCGVSYVDHADNAVDGLNMIEAAIAEGKPYDLPVIVCSSARLVIPEIVGCIHYSPYRNDLDADMRELVEQVRGM